jgi:hypothetical protein
MISPDVFHRLRAAQLRAVHEQELLSGRDWILICACVHVLALVYPAFLWAHVWLLHSSSLNQHLHPVITVAFTFASGLVLLGFWWWSHYAPYRGALGALIAYIALQTALASLDAHQLIVGATFKAFILLGLLQAVLVSHRRRRPL